ncbi:MAG: class I SAM-dependent methyltransferase, partial [Pseudomonadota bacterium]
MASPAHRIAGRMRYGAGQLGRMAWFLGHDAAMTRLRRRAEAETGPSDISTFRPSEPTPDQRRLFAEIGRLLRTDLANVEAGLYPMPEDRISLPDLIGRSRAFFADLPKIHRRRMEKDHQEVFTDDRKGTLPRYYLQNFHYQTDGYLSDDSARIYDIQVEVLFKGTASAMRRQALVPIANWMHGRDQRKVSLVDVACGTGRFLDQIKQAYPLMPVTGVDLSAAYVAEARRHLRRRGQVSLAVANGEHLP